MGRNENKIDWAVIMETKRDEIEEAIKQAKKEAEGCMSGWHVDVEIDEESVWVTGLRAMGSQSKSSFNGTSYIVASMQSWNPDLNEAELIREEPFVYAEFLLQKDSDDGYEYADEFMKKKYPEKLKEWKDEAIDYEISEIDVSSILDHAIEQSKASYNQ